jgi:transcriptional regulator with XRE-family HTH domain
MHPIRALRERAALTQQSLAVAGGTSQPTIAAYEAGHKSPTVQTLQRLASAVGLRVTIVYSTPLTREEQRSLELHRAIARHLAADPAAVIARARRNVRRMRARRGQATKLLREWSVILDRPVEALCAVLTDPGEWARELRHVTPFAGALSASERAAVYEALRRTNNRGLLGADALKKRSPKAKRLDARVRSAAASRIQA